MGTLHAQSSGRQEVFSFEYAPEWLVSEAAFAFDPYLQLLEAPQIHSVAYAFFSTRLPTDGDAC